jgi:hypothetical protein
VGFFNRELGVSLTDDEEDEDDSHDDEEDGCQGDSLFINNVSLDVAVNSEIHPSDLTEDEPSSWPSPKAGWRSSVGGMASPSSCASPPWLRVRRCLLRSRHRTLHRLRPRQRLRRRPNRALSTYHGCGRPRLWSLSSTMSSSSRIIWIKIYQINLNDF